MNEKTQKSNTLSILIFESISVLDVAITIDIILIEAASMAHISFNAKETAKLREILRISVGSNVDKLTTEELNEFGATMLQITAIVLKAKHALKKITTLKVINKINNKKYHDTTKRTIPKI